MRDRADGSADPGDAGSPGRRRWARAIGVLLRFGFRADPRLVAGFYAVVAVWQVAILGGAYATKLIVDAAVRADQRGAAFAAAAFGVAAVASSLCARTHLKIAFRLQEKVNQLIDRELMALIGGIPGLEHHEHPRFHDEVSLVRSQQYLLSRMTHAVVQNFRYWLQLFGTAALLARLDPLLLALPLFGAGSLLTGRKGQAWESRAQEATAERRRLRRHLFDLATSAAAGKELRVFDAAGWIIARHEALSKEVDGEISRVARKRTLLDAVESLCFAVGYAGAIGLALRRALAGEASPGDVVLAISLAAQMTGTVGGIVGVTNFLRNAARAATRYLWLADYAERARRPALEPAPVPAHLRDGIALEGVAFRYPQTDGVVLRDLSVHFPAGSVVALVGENGAGKTTLVKLLCRFYEPTAGRILVDGVDLRRFDIAAWRRRLSAGFQDFSRFEFTLRDTIGVGDLSRRLDRPALEHALARAGAGGMAGTLPGGWDTQLGTAWPGGVDLSGGQWQKLALARALLRVDPLLVVFDEPTAALDAPTEHALFERLAAAARSGTSAGTVTLIVSHRFSTVRMADRIVVVDGGRVVACGTHDELMAQAGLYAELYKLQARAYRT